MGDLYGTHSEQKVTLPHATLHFALTDYPLEDSLTANLPKEGQGMNLGRGFPPQHGLDEAPFSTLAKYSHLLSVVHRTFAEISGSTTVLRQLLH